MKLFSSQVPKNPFSKKCGGGETRGSPISQKHLRSLRDNGVPEKAVLNPYGQCGNTRRARYRATFFKRTVKKGFRDKAMKRTRIRMQKKKALILEAHELQKMARENATLAMNTLIEISGNKRAPEANRIAASAVILDRAYGKASSTSITANVGSTKASDVDGNELNKRIDQALKRVDSLTRTTPSATVKTKKVDKTLN